MKRKMSKSAVDHVHVGPPVITCECCQTPMFATVPRMVGQDHSKWCRIHCTNGHAMLVCINCDFGLYEDETPERVAQHQ